MNRRAIASLILIASASLARADTLAIRRPDAPQDSAPTVYSDVQVTNIADGRVAFTTSSGNEVDKPLNSVVAMDINDEPQFNAAMQAMAAGKFGEATDDFDETIQKTAKPWLKSYCEPLFTDAAAKSGRFDKAVQGYINLVMKQTSIAAAHRPTTPGPDSGYLDSAAQSLNDAADDPNLSTQQQQSILSLLLEVDRARNNPVDIASVASRLAKLTGSTPNPVANDASLALADAKLTLAQSALAQKNYDQAASIITTSGNLFLDPRRQSDALYILAQSRQGQAESKNDSNGWKDVAIAYMRIVADFKDAPGAPHVADALLATASILEDHLNQGSKALRMYQSIQKQFPGTPAADQAADRISRLQSAGVQPD
jgi:TolA-binding protein